MQLILLFFILFSFNAHADITSNLVSHWKLDDCSGSTAVDSIAANNLTLTDTVWVTGWAGGCALKFNGTTAIGESGSNTGVDAAEARTITWKAHSISDGTMVAIGAAGTHALFGGLCLGETWFLNMYGADDLDTGKSCDVNWHTHAIWSNGTDIKYYVDAIEMGTLTVTPETTNSTFQLGFQNAAGIPVNAGAVIDDVRLYSRALSVGDLQELDSREARIGSGTIGSAKFF